MVAMKLTLCAALLISGSALAGPPPGVASPWNGPWGGGYLQREPYVPWDSPYFAAGYGYFYPSVVHGLESPLPPVPGQGALGPGVQMLPGGGYILLPSPGLVPGGMGGGY